MFLKYLLYKYIYNLILLYIKYIFLKIGNKKKIKVIISQENILNWIFIYIILFFLIIYNDFFFIY